MGIFAREVMRDITKPAGGGSAAPSGFGDIDPMEAGRASSAAAAIHARYEGLINAIMGDRGMTEAQRASAILSLRIRQAAEAAAASQRIIENAKGAAKLRRMMQRLTR